MFAPDIARTLTDERLWAPSAPSPRPPRRSPRRTRRVVALAGGALVAGLRLAAMRPRRRPA